MKKHNKLAKAGQDKVASFFTKVQELEYLVAVKLSQYKSYTEKNLDDERYSEVAILEADINDSLKELEGSISNLDELMLTEALFDSIQSRQVERHKNNLHEYRIAFKKQKTNIKNVQRRRTLLQGASVSSSTSTQEEILIRERAAIDSSSDQMSFLIGQAYDTRANLREQHSNILGSTSRLANVSQIFPNMNLLLRKIRNKKQRDKVILAIISAICIIGLFNYIF